MKEKQVKNIYKTLNSGLCLSCGICAGVCPFHAIVMKRTEKEIQHRPYIDIARCTNCSMCQKVCPGLSANDIYSKEKNSITDYMRGSVLAAYNGYTKDNAILKNAASGGIVTTIVKKLLEDKTYDYAVGVKKTIYGQRSIVELINEISTLNEFQKSKYNVASYESVIRFISENPDKKVIIIGVGCIINSIQKWIKIRNFDRNKYLFLGLFCNMTLTDHVVEYFYQYDLLNIRHFKVLEYRTKDKKSYWPGNVKLIDESDHEVIIPKEERRNVCEYFQNERCLYCLNHLNVQADIALGDNYTPKMKNNKWGSSSIIIRTENGKDIFNKILADIQLSDINVNAIVKSQGIDRKKDNYIYSKIYEHQKKIKINSNIKYNQSGFDYLKEYNKRIKKISIGKKYHNSPHLFNLYFILINKSKIRNRLKVWRKV